MMEKNKTLLIIIPAYNEEKVIGSVVRDAIKTFKSFEIETKVLVIDDHSSDRTSSEAIKAGAIVVRHLINTGVGGATRTGLIYAELNEYSVAACMDADGQHLSIDVARGVKKILEQKVDLLIGTRLVNTSGMSRIKILGNYGLSLITRLLFSVKVTDSQSGLRILSRRSIKNLRWKSCGYEFCSELLWRAKQSKLIIDEYPIQAIYTDYSKSKGQSNWNGLKIVNSLLKHRLLEIFE